MIFVVFQIECFCFPQSVSSNLLNTYAGIHIVKKAVVENDFAYFTGNSTVETKLFTPLMLRLTVYN